jgi:hypothetical protein
MLTLIAANPAAEAGQIIINLFAVAGAFLFGNYSAGGVLKIFQKMTLKKALPVWAQSWTRLASGIVAAIIAALILFGDGGFGLGGSGGGKPGGPQKQLNPDS